MIKKHAKKKREDKNDGTTEKVIQIRRVNKVVKGGKRLAFRATVVVGDLKGSVGLGVGKAGEVPIAIKKAIDSARKSMINVRTAEGTIPHDVMGKFGSSTLVLKPAPKGTGVIAGGSVRIILELAGIKDIVAKLTGSNNAINSARATLNGLEQIKDIQEVANLRGKELHVVYHGSKEVHKVKPMADKKEEAPKVEDKKEETETK